MKWHPWSGCNRPNCKKPLHCKKILNYFELKKSFCLYFVFVYMSVWNRVHSETLFIFFPCRGENCNKSLKMFKKQPSRGALKKSHFGMGVLLWICCIFSEHLFLRVPLDGCFWSLTFDEIYDTYADFNNDLELDINTYILLIHTLSWLEKPVLKNI